MKINFSALKIARIISYLFIPPVMNLLTFLYLSGFSEGKTKITIILLSALFGVIIPIIFFIIMRRKGKIDDDDAKIKEQRSVPYLFGIFLIVIAIILSINFKLPEIIVVVWIAYLLNSVILLTVNKIWKMSAHALGTAIPVGVVLHFSIEMTCVFLLILLITSWSRLKLKVHTPAQVLAGALTGITVTFFTIYFLG